MRTDFRDSTAKISEGIWRGFRLPQVGHHGGSENLVVKDGSDGENPRAMLRQSSRLERVESK
jgi:hypothetical protein